MQLAAHGLDQVLADIESQSVALFTGGGVQLEDTLLLGVMDTRSRIEHSQLDRAFLVAIIVVRLHHNYSALQ